MDADALKGVLGELAQVMPEVARRTSRISARTDAAAERVAALATRLEQMRIPLDEPGSSPGDIVERLTRTAAAADETLGRRRDEVAARLIALPATLTAGQSAIETARDDTRQMASDLKQRLQDAAEALAGSGGELTQRATTFIEASDQAQQRLDTALDVTIEEATRVRDEAHAAQGVLVERVHQLVAVVQGHQQRSQESLRATSKAFGQSQDALAEQTERVREDLVRSGAIGMATELRRALMQEMGPTLETAQQSVLGALSEMQRTVAEMCTAANSARTTTAPLLRDLDGLVRSLADAVDSVRDAAVTAGVPF